MMKTVLLIGCGGFLGAVARYLLTIGISRFLTQQIYGIAVANLLGSFLIGILFFISHKNLNLSNEIKFFFGVGFLGAFTTYSTYALQSFELFQNHQIGLGIFNIILNAIGTILMVFFGWYLSHLIIK